MSDERRPAPGASLTNPTDELLRELARLAAAAEAALRVALAGADGDRLGSRSRRDTAIGRIGDWQQRIDERAAALLEAHGAASAEAKWARAAVRIAQNLVRVAGGAIRLAAGPSDRRAARVGLHGGVERYTEPVAESLMALVGDARAAIAAADASAAAALAADARLDEATDAAVRGLAAAVEPRNVASVIEGLGRCRQLQAIGDEVRAGCATLASTGVS